MDTKYVQDFDSFIHSNLYSYPDIIIKNLLKSSELLTRVILDTRQTIAIVSDHGLTALSRYAASKKYGKDDSHEGRFIEVKDKEHIPDTDYIIHKSEIDQRNYLIALNTIH